MTYTEEFAYKTIDLLKTEFGESFIQINFDIQDFGKFLLIQGYMKDGMADIEQAKLRKKLKTLLISIFPKEEVELTWMFVFLRQGEVVDSIMAEYII